MRLGIFQKRKKNINVSFWKCSILKVCQCWSNLAPSKRASSWEVVDQETSRLYNNLFASSDILGFQWQDPTLSSSQSWESERPWYWVFYHQTFWEENNPDVLELKKKYRLTSLKPRALQSSFHGVPWLMVHGYSTYSGGITLMNGWKFFPVYKWGQWGLEPPRTLTSVTS